MAFNSLLLYIVYLKDQAVISFFVLVICVLKYSMIFVNGNTNMVLKSFHRQNHNIGITWATCEVAHVSLV